MFHFTRAHRIVSYHLIKVPWGFAEREKNVQSPQLYVLINQCKESRKKGRISSEQRDSKFRFKNEMFFLQYLLTNYN